LSYFGRGYHSLADNDSTKFYLVLLIVAGVTLGVKLIINIGQIELFPTEVDKILKEKSKKGYLSLGNLNPHINPKELLAHFHTRFFSSDGSDEDMSSKSKRMKREKEKLK